MENKYFTPSIEDIRVGYEFQQIEDLPDGTRTKNWIDRKIQDNYIITFSKIKDELSNNNLRVPYLTKEQIEAEGWGNVTFHWKKGDYNLMPPFDETYLLRIYKGTEPVFQGECKDINTFRYICKLLNIN